MIPLQPPRLSIGAAPDPALGLLAAFEFAVPGAAALPCIRPPLSVLGEPSTESWQAVGEVRNAVWESLTLRQSGDFVFGLLHVDSADIEYAAFAAYRQLDSFLLAHPALHLLRAWNFFDRLNEGAGDDERYRRFCVGRHRAIARPGFEARLCAATVIGTQAPGLWIPFLAGRTPGIAIENPRQMSAWRYPRDYGEASPSFARATLVGDSLLVSGTAAIVGHATLHPGDAGAQLDETLANLGALLDAAARRRGCPAQDWSAKALRLYLRTPDQAENFGQRVRKTFGQTTSLQILVGDISRRDLLLEIEGVWSRGKAF